MKKLLVLLILAFPFTSHAMVYGFMDGKYYDESYQLKYFCFLDKKCYNTNGGYVPTEVITGVAAPHPTPTVAPLENSITYNNTMPEIKDLPRCLDIPVRGSFGSEDEVISCRYTYKGTEHQYDAEFIADMLTGPAKKKLTNGTSTLYVDENNVKVK